ncbi:MAG: hypothetical protein JGK27_21115 [Microcoleus sp. PH2017_20_SFW_D_A]|uniref:hypothetical protein n=1 Tax=unclassified Microcoleus TaxID=2642155 RepID=UPI001DC4B3A6|nr:MULTISPECIES: hypothetical protein [unclassified Microcoleus]MCC3469908.1 hypothetical protein [Microcoleus sp. PH2017_06_SFM_O_A]MCC3504744.1 hypothetical protein [Microcoleus sp. PH2017_19_SFW_U_A]MCC3524142.1 hypothetical protein [Microcoleus sp. PH2017_20_SFW_D_A]MCC3556262.1 hypothetical protein [Microcoleus sp. PH2017_35_SFW_U_B]MCC3569331.1 hypothetical protein [Microcoleus sp. PH2017_31_RDM_U_A]MCC3586976.1 hypothetical protein [Microcoleus sp. PH2017_30_WIL_O_A]
MEKLTVVGCVAQEKSLTQYRQSHGDAPYTISPNFYYKKVLGLFLPSVFFRCGSVKMSVKFRHCQGRHTLQFNRVFQVRICKNVCQIPALSRATHPTIQPGFSGADM